jgi:hypothetical protein
MNKYVVHCKKDKYDVLIDRTTKWGNPFKKENAREENILEFKKWVVSQHDLMNDLHSLKEKVLACWCAPKACHGDVLSQLVNGDENTVRLLVAGSRSFNNYKEMEAFLDISIKEKYSGKEVIGISGTAKGADILAIQYFKSRNIICMELPAIWNNKDGTTNKAAGYERNTRMVNLADAAIFFWDGKSNGTYDTINKCRKKGIDRMGMYVF